MHDLGTKIRKLRKEKGYSAKELSERSGVARSLISQLETGRRRSTGMDTVQRLAKALEIPASHLLDEDEEGAPFSYKKTKDNLAKFITKENQSYLLTIQKAQKAGLTPELLNELIDLILRIRAN